MSEIRFGRYDHEEAVEQLVGDLRTTRFNLAIQTPVDQYPNYEIGSYDHHRGGRTLIVIEGHNELVQPYLDAIRAIYDDHQGEYEA